ncbi:hypothetical protein QR680_004037 [Steinernema hermaphroditum]|uniref:Uncharacterized protein n=1 Tax=Steinernema hermaphroditum TaxID=289476 RepID=A0AA39HPP4_9BILA|nr:hypothetical protein QR680_004037 [Steinernema hermaphroditum]
MQVLSTLLLLSVLLAFVASVPYSWRRPYSEQLTQMMIDRMNDDGLFELRPVVDSREKKSKRSRCVINGGLSQGCDMSDMIFAKQQASKFSSFAGPGK